MKAIGIDLGTTNSVAAYCEPGSKSPPRVLGTSAGESFTPSVVGARRSPREANGWEVLVGRAAANYAPRAPEETVFSIKRLMGRDFADPQVGKLRGRFGYRVVAGPGEDPRAHVELAGELWSPARISSRILEQIRLEAARDLGEVRQAVITVPAYFHEGQRAATREAGEAAGLLVKKIIDEPTAAAVAFGVEARPGEHHRLLVYDLGGGTFDISILQLVKDEEGHNHFEVLEIEGDAWLGGDDFDLSIVEKIIATVAGQTGEDPAVDRRFLLLAKEHAEKAKKALSQSEVTEIVIPAAYRSKSNLVVDVELGLERAELEQAIRPLVERSMALVQKALERQNLSREDISDVLLVGGSTLVPLVYRTVESFFGAGRVRRSLNPMECVALGASLLAASLRGVECPSCGTLNPESAERCGRPGCGASLASARAVSEGLSVGEPTAMSLGIAAVEGEQADVFVPIIPKGTPYPLLEPLHQSFEPTGRRIRVPIYEGDDPVASRNKEQGVVEYELPEDCDLSSRVEVSFNYDRNRELTVTVRVPGTDFYKQETLRRDRPRSGATAAPSQPEGEEESWQEELEGILEFAHQFLSAYGEFMEDIQKSKLVRDLEKARGLLTATGTENDGRRVIRVIQTTVFNCGLATELFLADRATDGAQPEVARQINQAASLVRQALQQGARDLAAEQARLLKALVAQTLEARAGIEAIGDKADYGGLLRALGRSGR